MEGISAVSNTSIPFSHIIRASYSGGKIAVPLNDLAGIYTKFKHITGIPSFSDSAGVSMDRLRQLDTLIDQLSRIKGQDIGLDLSAGGGGALENLISSYSSQLRERLTASGVDFYKGIYEPGSILNLTA